MGGSISLWLDIDDYVEATHLFRLSKAIFSYVERTLSRFNHYSELCNLNRNPDRWVQVSRLLWEVTRLALDYAEETNGIFDPTIALDLKRAGYDRSFEQLKFKTAGVDVSEAEEAPNIAGNFQQVKLAEDPHMIYLPKGIELDLGGIAKGYTVRRVANMLGRFGPALVDGSGDIMAVGKPRGLAGWPVGIAFPDTSDDKDLAFVWLADQALATSGIDRRHWGESAHHIIDPSTHQPARTTAVTTSILADDMVDADVYATVCLIAGEEVLPEAFAFLTVNNNNNIHLNLNMTKKLAWVSPLVNLA